MLPEQLLSILHCSNITGFFYRRYRRNRKNDPSLSLLDTHRVHVINRVTEV